MSIVNLDEVGVEPGQILADTVRQYRADCGLGQFKRGASVLMGNRLDMELVAAEKFYGRPFQKYPVPMEWLGVLFVDQDGVLSSILFKKESRANLLDLLTTLKVAKQSVLGSVVRATMSQRAGQGKDDKGNPIAVSYFAVEFEVLEKSAKYASAIQALRCTMDCHALIEFKESAPAAESKAQILAAVRATA